MGGLIVVVSGPGGVGKGTVVAELVKRDAHLALSRSWTTRDRRPGEAEDAYTFASTEEFLAHREAGGFLEWNHFLGENYYGSPVPEVDAEDDLVLEIDVNGARHVHEGGYEALYIFIDTPSIDAQRARLIGRGDTAEKVEQRMSAGQVERDLAESLPYLYVINDDLEGCTDEVADLIEDYRRLRSG